MRKLKVEHELKNGWTRWVPPLHRGYMLVCCDCGLAHDMEFKVVKVKKTMKDGTWLYHDVPGGKFRVMFRAARNNRSTGQTRRHRKSRTTP